MNSKPKLKSRPTQTSTASRPKVPLYEAESQLQMIEELLNQLQMMDNAEITDLAALSPEQVESLEAQKHQQVAGILSEMMTEAQEDFAAAINRMLNRAAFDTRQAVSQEAVARYYRGQASTLNQEVSRCRNRVSRIKGTIAAALEMQRQSRFDTAQHKMHLSSTTRVVIDEGAVPGLEGLVALNVKYPGILRQLKFGESGRLVDVEFSQDVLKRLLKSGDEEILTDLNFARLITTRYLVVPTISEAKMKDQVKVQVTEYGPELS